MNGHLPTCERGHALRRFRIQDTYFCSICEKTVEDKSFMFTCFADDFDACQACYAELLNKEESVLQARRLFHSKNKWEVFNPSAALSLSEEALRPFLSSPSSSQSLQDLLEGAISLHDVCDEATILLDCFQAHANAVLDQVMIARECPAHLLEGFITRFAHALSPALMLQVLLHPRFAALSPKQVLNCLVDLANYHDFSLLGEDGARAMDLIQRGIFNSLGALEQELALHALGNMALSSKFTFPAGIPQFVSSLLQAEARSSDQVLKLAIRILYCYCGSSGELTPERLLGDQVIVNYAPQLIRIGQTRAQLTTYVLNRLSYLSSQSEYHALLFQQSVDSTNIIVLDTLFDFALQHESEAVRALAFENLSKARVEDLKLHPSFDILLQRMEEGGDANATRFQEAIGFFDNLAATKSNRLALAADRDFCSKLLPLLHQHPTALAIVCSLSVDSPQQVFDEPQVLTSVLRVLGDDSLGDDMRERAGSVLEYLASYQPLKTPLFAHEGLVQVLLEQINLPRNPRIALRCVRALGFLSWENCAQMFQLPNLMPVLLRTMDSEVSELTVDLIEQAANVVGNLALEEDLRGPLFNYPGLLPLLIDKLTRADPVAAHTKSSLLRILQQVSIPFKFEAFRFAGMGNMLVRLLTYGDEVVGGDDLREECLEYCCHLSCEPRNKAPMLHFPGLFAALVNMVREQQQRDRPLLVKNALIAIAHLAWENRVEIANFPNLLSNLVQCLSDGEDEDAATTSGARPVAVTDHAATVCNNLALEPENHEMLFDFPGLVLSLLNSAYRTWPSSPRSAITRRWANAALVSLTGTLPRNKLGMLENRTYMRVLLNAVFDGAHDFLLELFLNLGWTEQQLRDFALEARSMLAFCTVKQCARIGFQSPLAVLPMHLLRDTCRYLY